MTAGAGALATAALRPDPRTMARTMARTTAEARVESWIERLSPAEKVAQLFTVTVAGTALTSEETAWLTEWKLGGVILVESNIGFAPELRALIAAIAATNPDLPPLISVDQEGGPVTRLYSDPVPGPAELARLPIDEVRELARVRGEFLADFGFAINYAPVADVAYEPESFMAGRALGADPATVAAKVAAIVEGTNLTPVRATAKHFPGHGRTAVDSHLALPEVDISFAEWWETDALPFRAAVEASVPLVMLGHLLYPAWDTVPSSLSGVVVEVLRDDFQFDGVIVSDDLGMDALGQIHPFAVVDQAITAGLDCLLYVTPRLPIADLIGYLIGLVETGLVPIARIDASLRRLLRLRV
ncbi:MAG: beta-hexosaminidase [Chloroflexia bacterium]|nr:beta-hexosaminidase [Chloroflexia bacterium]